MRSRDHACGRLRQLASIVAVVGLLWSAQGHPARAQPSAIVVVVVHDEDDAAVYAALEAMIGRPLLRHEAAFELDAAALDACGRTLRASVVLDVRAGVLRVLRVGPASLTQRALAGDAASSAYTRALALAELLELDQQRDHSPGATDYAVAAPPHQDSQEASPPPAEPSAPIAPQEPPLLRVAPSIAVGGSLSLALDGDPWLVQPALALGLTFTPHDEAFFIDAVVSAAGFGRFGRPLGEQQVEYARAELVAGVGLGARVGILTLSVRALGGVAFRQGEARPAGRGVDAFVPELGASANVRAYLVAGLFAGIGVGTLWILEPTTFTLGGMRALREGAPHLLIDVQVGWAFE